MNPDLERSRWASGEGTVHPLYDKPNGITPGLNLGMTVGEADRKNGVIVTYADNDNYYFDPDLKIEGRSHVWLDRAPGGRPGWVQIQR